MKQSSIEFLQECLSIHLTHEQKIQFDGLFQQAIAMHKEEIKNAYNSGQESNWSEDMGLMGDWYYDETFNSKEK